MKFKDYVINGTWTKINGEPMLKILDKSKKVRFIKFPFRPYFFITKSDYFSKGKHIIEKTAEEYKIDYEIEFADAITADTKEFAVQISTLFPSDVKKLRLALEGHGIRTYEADIPYFRRCLLDLPDSLTKPKKILYMDIETDSRERFSEAEEAANRIISIGAVDCKGREFFFSYDNEAEMIADFFDLAKKYELLVAWNANYDITYLANRAKKLGLTIGHVSKRGDKTYIFEHPHLDLQKVFKNVFRRKVRSYALKAVAKDFLGKQDVIEIETREDMIKLWESFVGDKKLLREYNLQDCWLLKEIDEAANLLDIQYSIVELCSLESYEARGMSTYVESYLLKVAKDEVPRIVFPTKIREEDNDIQDDEEESYKGGLVENRSPGLHKNIILLDINSTYPMIIKTFNIGLETFKEKKWEGDIIVPHGSFTLKIESVLAKMVDNLIALRKWAKENRNKYHPDSIEYKIWDAVQFSYKFIVNCVTPGHRVLTTRGFIPVEEIKEGDLVYTLNPETFEVEVVPVVKTVKQYYKGPIVKIDGKRISIHCTPNHRFFVKKKRWSSSKRVYVEDKFEFVEAEEFLRMKPSHRFELPTHKPIKGKKQDTFKFDIKVKYYHPNTDIKVPEEVPMKSFLRFLGWYVSEGHVNGNTIDISNTDEKNREEIVKTLKGLGIERIRVYENRIQFNSTLYARWLEKNCGRVAREKRLPEWVFELDHSLLKELFDSLMKGDGNLKVFSYGTSSKQLCEDVTRLAIHLGYIPRVRKRKDKNGNDEYIITIREDTQDIWKSNVSVINYDGYVYCITAEKNHIVLFEKDGKILWSGNSIYGVLGFEDSRVYRRELAENVTLLCRAIIRFVDEYLKSNFKNIQVIYIDTDGLYVKLPDNLTKEQIVEVGQYLVHKINDALKKWIPIEFGVPEDRVFIEIKLDRAAYTAYFPERKKAYGLKCLYEDGQFVDYYHIKGFGVKSNMPELCKEIQRKVLEMILNEKPSSEIVKYLKEVRERLFKGELDDKLVMYITLRKDPSEYKRKTAHVVVAEKLKKMGIPVAVGDKIAAIPLGSVDNYIPYIPGKTKLTKKQYELFWNNYVISALEQLDLDESILSKVRDLSQKSLSDFFS